MFSRREATTFVMADWTGVEEEEEEEVEEEEEGSMQGEDWREERARSGVAAASSLALLLTLAHSCLNRLLRAAKSVSLFTSISAALFPFTLSPTSPSEAARPDFFAAVLIPFFRRNSTAASSKDASVEAEESNLGSAKTLERASRHSVMGAPVRSRSNLIWAVVALAGAAAVENEAAADDEEARGAAEQLGHAWSAVGA